MADTTSPTPTDAWEVARWEHTRLRRRMLTGEWREDLVAALRKTLGWEQSEEIATVDMSSNVFLACCTNLAVNYDVAPVVTHDDASAAQLMNALLDDAGYAPTMQRVQRLTLGLREMLVRVHVTEATSGPLPVSLALEPVYPDLVIGRPVPGRAHELLSVDLASQADVGGETRWVWERMSAETGVYDVVDKDGAPVGTAATLAADAAGKHVLPVVLYHAEIGPSLWDHTQWRELVEGTLNIAVKRTAASHNLINASYVQRYTIGLRLQGATELDGRHVVSGGASKVMALDYDGEGNTGTAGAWPQGFDPSTFQEALREAESQLASNSGIPVTDLLRGSGDPRSGFSLMLSRESKKEQSRRLEPACRRGDLLLLRTIAVMVNAAAGSGLLPESGWGIQYRALPMSEDELAAKQKNVLDQLGRGLMSEVEARAELRGETLDQARLAIDAIIAERMRGSVALTVGAQSMIDVVLATVERGDRSAETAYVQLTSALGMQADAAKAALAGITVRRAPAQTTP